MEYAFISETKSRPHIMERVPLTKLFCILHAHQFVLYEFDTFSTYFLYSHFIFLIQRNFGMKFPASHRGPPCPVCIL